MKRIRIPWHLLAGLILGLGLGIVISWMIPSSAATDAPPSHLRNNFRDEYRALIASAYASTKDLSRAKDRLAALNDQNAIEALESQAQRALAEGASTESLDALAILAANLKAEIAATQITATSTKFLTQTPLSTGKTPTPTENESTPEPATATLTPIPLNTRTPRPTTIASPTPRAPYLLQTKDEICSTNISEGLLMVYVSDASQKAMPGVEIILSQEGKEEHFFTGLKPELGDGYADFMMEAGQFYSLRLAAGSTAATELSAPPCVDENGNHYWGSLRLKFQQP